MTKHRHQTVRTECVEDDPDPEFGCAFKNMVIYRDSGKVGKVTTGTTQRLTIEVFDSANLKKKQNPVLLGKARLDIKNGTIASETVNGVDQMTGDEEIELDLSPPQNERRMESAGMVTLRLTYTPSPASVLSLAAVSMTKTWYYESTVLGMCALSMIGLALRSPAVPPSPNLYHLRSNLSLL